MYTLKNVIHLDEVRGYKPAQDGVFYTDKTGSQIFIPMAVLVRLYEGVQFDFERNGGDWKKFCNNLFVEQ